MWRTWDYIKVHRKFIGGLILFSWSLGLVTSGGGQRVSPGPISKVIIPLISYPQRALTYSLNGIIGLGKNYLFLVGVQTENQKLKKFIAQLEKEKFQGQETRAENERLRDLLGFGSPRPYSTIPARVIGASSASAGYHSITINRGENSELRPGYPVLSHRGVVGRVCEVGFREAKVCLLTDRNSAIPVIIQRTRSRGIAVGAGEGRLEIRYLPRLEDVRAGDTVITSGLGRMFPRGIQVGIVEEVRRKSFGLFQEVWADPSANLPQLEEVLVILPPEEP